VVIAAEEKVTPMATPKTRANARKQSERLKAQEREKRRLYFMKRGEKFIPDAVIKKLADLRVTEPIHLFMQLASKSLCGSSRDESGPAVLIRNLSARMTPAVTTEEWGRRFFHKE
jgi:hypothetical protein